MTNVKTVLRITAIVFVAEISIMFFIFVAPNPLQEFGTSKIWFWPLVDTTFLVLFTSPLIYYWVIRPFSSARDAAEAELRQFKTTLDLSTEQIYINRPDTLQFIFMNQAAQTAFGWNESEYPEKSLHDINSKFDETRFRKATQPLVFGTKESNVFETTGNNQEPLEITQQLINSEGEEPRFVSIVRDIAERKKAEKAKSEFISTVSHELRTPLTSIKGALGLIRNGVVKDDPVKLKRLMDMAATNADRLELLINDILDVEKLNAETSSISTNTVNLSHLVKEAVMAHEGYAEKFGVSFRTTGVDIPVLVNGEDNRLMQVMANLMSNAAKFSPKGGEIEVSLVLSGSNARVSVSDHGCGIPEAAKKTIFDRFTQVDSSDRKGKGGTGLGLNIAKAIVERHHGTIGCTSEVGAGSTFFFELPIKTAEQKVPDVAETIGKTPKRVNSANAV